MKNKFKLIKKLGRKRTLLIALLVLIVAGAVGGWYALRSDSSNTDYVVDPNFKRTSGERLADISSRKVKTFEQCVQAGGPVEDSNGSIDECYHEGVVYSKVPRKGLEDLNPPRYLVNYYDCMSGEGLPDHRNVSCNSWTGVTFYYRGPKITNYEECDKWSGGLRNLIINAPCIAPDGTRFEHPSAPRRMY